VNGVVNDATGAVVPGARVSLSNPVTSYERSRLTDERGRFAFANVPLNPYHLTVTMDGFAPYAEEVDVRSSVPVTLSVSLKLANTSASVTVEAGDLLEREPTAHTDVDRSLFDKLPLESTSSGLSSLVTLSTPGVVADSNGLFHGLGEHADNQFSIDGQPITDQQSKVFSNQLPVDAVQSLEVISGLPPAEYGDRNSLVIKVVTRSGLESQGVHGSLSATYGTFLTPTGGLTLSMGGAHFGNFLSVNGMRTDRFLDPPEATAIHDAGNEENVFDRVDWQGGGRDTVRLNLGYTSSSFDIPDTLDQAATNQAQHQAISTFNASPGWNHIFNSSTLLSTTAFVRHDHVVYQPSPDVFDDSPATLRQVRDLTNLGFQASLSYVRGNHTFKAGLQYAHWNLGETFGLGITDPLFNAPCLGAGGAPAEGGTVPAQCSSLGAGFQGNPSFLPGLLPYDLTRGGQAFSFNGSAGINEESLFVQDTITWSHVTLNLGARADNYDGISRDRLVEPRVSASYNIPASQSVIRVGFGRFLETPFNENLVLSSSTGAGGLASATGALAQSPVRAGHRDQYDAGFQQQLGPWLILDGEYFWKYTNPAYDFDVLLNTPLTFPIQWSRSKIDGFSIRMTLPKTHGLSAYADVGHTRSRFFGPETGGIIFNSPVDASVFRIDHDQALQTTFHVQYQPAANRPWVGFTWRYDSGLVAGSVPTYASALALDADQQAAIGLYCGSQFATPQAALTGCPAGLAQGATRLVIPAPGTENDDLNPPRIAPRNLFDAAAGIDDIFGGSRVKVGARVSVLNIGNTEALYNFLSTFSGTHFVSPRAVTAEVSMHF
jgi:hypothetical protein